MSDMEMMIYKAKIELRVAKSVINANHVWHKEYDDVDGYNGSALESANTSTIRQIDKLLEQLEAT